MLEIKVIPGDLRDLTESIGKLFGPRTTEIYKGTASKATLDFMNKAKEDISRAMDVFEKQKSEFWDRVCSELEIDREKHHKLNPLTGQVIEIVPVESFNSPESSEEINNAG